MPPIPTSAKEAMETLLEVRDLRTYFPTHQGTVHAVDGVSFEVTRGRTVGVVGESGCGKSVMARSILLIVPKPGRIVRGEILLYGKEGGKPVDLASLNERGPEIRAIRGNTIAMIFQEPMSSLSPVHTVGNQITEAILLHRRVERRTAREIAIQMLDKVGIAKPRRSIDSYPHQLSGGMRQRAMIAMALVCTPRLLIADEPTTALDVTIQAQILDLMRNLQAELDMAILFITHNLGVIAEIADYVLVMYLGRVVERAPVGELFSHPAHPYTKALLKSIPQPGGRDKPRLQPIRGTVPIPFNMPPSCAFSPRCDLREDARCRDGVPEEVEVAPGHFIRCCRCGEG